MRGRTTHNLVLLKGKGQAEPTMTGAWTDKYCDILLRLISVACESYKSVLLHSLIVQQGDRFVHVGVVDKEKEKRYVLSTLCRFRN